ncbi:hypothetical protein WDV06_16720 [Streptomyces racemochromogenes]|uniref:Uncharacterized protein n=1 Tax=Streptomyces racemochromogenes TaxID=67353 RepID=A0ABW7PEB1_9ACTN
MTSTASGTARTGRYVVGAIETVAGRLAGAGVEPLTLLARLTWRRPLSDPSTTMAL